MQFVDLPVNLVKRGINSEEHGAWWARDQLKRWNGKNISHSKWRIKGKRHLSKREAREEVKLQAARVHSTGPETEGKRWRRGKGGQL